jgi:hypothetical protein
VSNPEAPFVRSEFFTPGGIARDSVVAGGLAYVLDGFTGGLVIYDVSNPDAPFLIGSFDPPNGLGRAIALEGNRVYVVETAVSNMTIIGAMTIIDVSDPTAPAPLGSLFVPDDPRDIAVAGEIVYVGNDNSLVIIDASDPTAPTEIASLPFPAPGVAVADDLAYTVYPLRVIDVLDPANPVEVGSHSLPAPFSSAIALADQLAFVGESRGFGSAVLHVFDIADPAAPFHLGGFEMAGSIEDLAIAGGLVFVANIGSGLSIVDFGPEYLPEPQGWMMLAAGAAMLGLLERRRQRQTA